MYFEPHKEHKMHISFCVYQIEAKQTISTALFRIFVKFSRIQDNGSIFYVNPPTDKASNFYFSLFLMVLKS